MRIPEVKVVEPLEKKFPKFSSEAVDVMKQCLCLDPNDRPSSSSLLRHEFFRKDNFEEKVIPEIRARIQKEFQQNQMVKKNLAEKQQQKREDDAENKKKRRKESNASGSKDTLPTPPSSTNTGLKLQEINTKNDTKNLPNKKDTNVGSPRKTSLASLNTSNKTPPSDEKRKSKEGEKERKLPAAIKQDNSVVTGPPKPPSQPQKQQTFKDDFLMPRTLIPKVTNESMTRDTLKNTPLEAAMSPTKDKSPRELKAMSDTRHVKISTDVDSGAKGSNKLTKTPPLISEKSPKQPKASILKNPSQTGLRGSKEGVIFDSPTLKGSVESVTEKRGNIKPDQNILPLTKSISDTVAFRDKKIISQEKQSTSTPTTPVELTSQLKPSKSQRERSPKKAELSPKKSQKDAVLEKKDKPTSSKEASYHIPPIQSQTGPVQSSKNNQNELESSVDALKQFPTQGIRVLEKTKKLSPTKDSFSPQTSYEKSIYGSSVSNFEKMMVSMSGATTISHPAIKKSNTSGEGTSVSSYSQGQSPHTQQFGIHFPRDESKPTKASLPLWSTNAQSYYDKHHAHRNAVQDSRSSELDRKQKSDEKSHHHHHRHHHKYEDKANDEKQGKYYSKGLEDKVTALDTKRTRLPDLMRRGMGVGGMSTSRPDDFSGYKQTGNEYQIRSKPKLQKQVFMSIPTLETSQTTKQHNSTSPNDNLMQHDSNLPSVRRKL